MTKNKIKVRRCKNCEVIFQPLRQMQGVCSPVCAYEYQNTLKKKKAERDWKKEKSELKSKLLTHSDYIQLLQKVFNTFIRLRDKDKGCISCGTDLSKNKYDAGHFMPTTYQYLRFEEDNVHGQCVQCNQHKHGNIHEYTIGIENRIGFERLQWIHANRHKRLELSIPEIKDLIKKYKLKIKELNL